MEFVLCYMVVFVCQAMYQGLSVDYIVQEHAIIKWVVVKEHGILKCVELKG